MINCQRLLSDRRPRLDQIFSPVVRFETVHLILALATLNKWYIQAIDVHNAYLYGKLDEEIYMEQPKGFRVKG